MVNTTLVTDFIKEIVKVFRKIDLRDFIMELRNRFYPDVTIEIMDKFLELESQENEGKFVVHHSMLIEYGVATSTKSGHVKDRLESLGLIMGEDYRGTDIRQPVKQGGFSTKHVYHLTPEAFFLALQRAQRRPNQKVDPTIYAKYFQFLQKVVKYYMMYQRDLEHALSLAKDDNIIFYDPYMIAKLKKLFVNIHSDHEHPNV